LDLEQYLRALGRRWWLIVLVALLSGAAALLVSQRIVPIYAASTTALIRQMPTNSTDLGVNSPFTNQSLPQTAAELLSGRPVLEAVIADLKLNTDSDSLTKRVNVTLVRDTQLLVLTVEDSSAQRAVDIANDMVRQFNEQNRALQASGYATLKSNLQQALTNVQADIARTQASLDALNASSAADPANQRAQLQALLDQYRSNYDYLLQAFEREQLAESQPTDILSVVEAAQPSTTPLRPQPQLYMLLAIIVGTFLAGGGVVLAEYLNDTVRSGEQVEQLLEVPTLGLIARLPGPTATDLLVTAADVRTPLAENYRLLAASIGFYSSDQPIRTILVTSSGPLEGKSTTAANLAVAMAQSGQRVILVDADLYRPRLHEFFKCPNERGISTVLKEDDVEAVNDYLLATGTSNLRLLPSGPQLLNSAELLGSQRMTRLIDKLKAQADLVLFDSPPLLGIVDATLLAHACDATLLVVLAAATRPAVLTKAKNQTLRSGAHLLGTVLNRVSPMRPSYADDYYDQGRGGQRRPHWWPDLGRLRVAGRNGVRPGDSARVADLPPSRLSEK
jgi:capsular exopolysaccharide synthesis family protein